MRELKDHPGQNVQHWAKWGIHEGNNWTATLIVFLLFGQDVAGWKLASFADSPRIGSSILSVEFGHQCERDVGRSVMDLTKDTRVQKSAFNCGVVPAWTENPQGRCMFVFTVEDRTGEQLFKLLNGRTGDVIGIRLDRGPESDAWC